VIKRPGSFYLHQLRLVGR